MQRPFVNDLAFRARALVQESGDVREREIGRHARDPFDHGQPGRHHGGGDDDGGQPFASLCAQVKGDRRGDYQRDGDYRGQRPESLPHGQRDLLQDVPGTVTRSRVAPMIAAGTRPHQKQSEAAHDQSRAADKRGAKHAQVPRGAIPYGGGPERERAPHAHRIIILPLADEQQGQKDHSHPDKRKRIGELQLAGAHDPAPGQHHTGQHEESPGEPPHQVERQKMRPGHIVIISEDATTPVVIHQVIKNSGIMLVHPKEPGNHDH